MMPNHGVAISPEQVPAMKAYLVKAYPVKGRPTAVVVSGAVNVSMKAWPPATPGARPHDPLAAGDGSLWYTGQMANALGAVDPKNGKVKEYRLKPRQHGPQGVVETRSVS